MANNTVKVRTNQLMDCANKYETLAKQYEDDLLAVENKLSECQNYWQGSFASDFDAIIDDINKVRVAVYDDTTQLAKFLEEAAKLYQKYDADIARALQDDPSKNAKDYPNNVAPAAYLKSEADLASFYKKTSDIAKRGTKNVGGGVSCAELTKAKMNENGFHMARIGNGNQTYGIIQSNDEFHAKHYPGNNCLKDLLEETDQPVTNIVVSFPTNSSPGNEQYGHVFYIDQIVDGQVYYSDNWVGGGTQPLVCPVDQLLARYKGLGNGDPIGCIHLSPQNI